MMAAVTSTHSGRITSDGSQFAGISAAALQSSLQPSWLTNHAQVGYVTLAELEKINPHLASAAAASHPGATTVLINHGANPHAPGLITLSSMPQNNQLIQNGGTHTQNFQIKAENATASMNGLIASHQNGTPQALVVYDKSIGAPQQSQPTSTAALLNGKYSTSNGAVVVHEKQHKCQYCTSSFARKDQLKRHCDSIHLGIANNGEKPHECEYCHTTFARKDQLKRHCDALHFGVRYRCQIPGCEKSYSRSDKLIHHRRRVHEGKVETVKCSFVNCGRAYADRKGLRRHLKKAHNLTTSQQQQQAGTQFNSQPNDSPHNQPPLNLAAQATNNGQANSNSSTS